MVIDVHLFSFSVTISTSKALGPGTSGSTVCISVYLISLDMSVAYPGIFFRGGSTNSVEDRGQRERGSGGCSHLVRGSGGSCNLVQEISFHIVKFS
jgi:hypothetical protein